MTGNRPWYHPRIISEYESDEVIFPPACNL
jgi:hypothetical protein